MAAPDLDSIVHIDDTEFQETWKQVYGKMYSSVPNHTVITNRLKRTKRYRNLGMDGLRFNVEMGIGGVVANMPDASRFTRSSKPKTKEGIADVVWTYTGFEIGGQAMAKSDREGAVYVSSVEHNTRSATKRAKLDIERQYNGDGRGILGIVSSVSGAPTYGIEKPYGVTGGGNGTMCLVEGMDVALINPGTGAERGRSTVVSYDPDAEEFELEATIDNDEIGDWVVRVNGAGYTGADRTKNLNLEANGILAWTGAGDEFEGIDGDDFRLWNGIQRLNGSSLRDISEMLVSELEAAIWAATGREDADILWYTSPFLRLKLASQLAARVQSGGGVTWKVKGGFRYAEINGREIAASPKCVRGRFFGLCMDRDVVGLLELPGGFLGEGQRLAKLRYREDYHTVKSDLVIPHNVIVHQRNAHGFVGDLNDDNGFTDN